MSEDVQIERWGVYVLLDPEQLHPSNELMATAEAAARGGAAALQLRDKRASGLELTEKAKKLETIASTHDVAFFVNDRFDVAMASGAHGVHLGPEDVPVRDACTVAPNLIVGGSAGTPQRAQKLEEEGAAYIGCGAVYDAGTSKPDASEPRGPGAVELVAEAVSIPVIGIGGIDAGNARAVVDAGADGVAVVRAVVGRPDPERATRELVESIR